MYSQSIYSINPLPESVTLLSFFIVLLILILVTALAGLFTTSLAAWKAKALRSSNSSKTNTKTHDTTENNREKNTTLLALHSLLQSLTRQFTPYLTYLEAVFTPPRTTWWFDQPPPKGAYLAVQLRPPAYRYWENSRALGSIYKGILIPLHHVVIPWMAWPRTLWFRFRFEKGWSATRAVRDFFVVLGSPLAVGLWLILTVILVAMDGAAWVWGSVVSGEGEEGEGERRQRGRR